MKATMMLAVTLVLVAKAYAQPNDEAQITGAPVAISAPDIMSSMQPIFAVASELNWFDLDPENAPRGADGDALGGSRGCCFWRIHAPAGWI